MTESAFDPSLFLDATTTDSAERRPPLPAGQDFVGTIEDISFRTSAGKKDPTKTYTFMDAKVRIAIPQDLQQSGQPPDLVLTAGIGVDTLGQGLDWSPGKNGQLGRWREALGMNRKGEQFSPRQMIGHQIRVKIKHELYNGEIYDRVDSVAKV